MGLSTFGTGTAVEGIPVLKWGVGDGDESVF